MLGMLDMVLTVGWTHASETGTSCISWTVPWSLHPGTLFPCCVKARSPMEFGMIWSVLTASIPANACTLLASIQLQKLTHRPHGTELYEEFQETHNICISKPDFPFLSFSKDLQNDVLSTKVNKTVMSAYDY